MLALPLVGFALLNFLTMMELLGRTEKTISPKLLKGVHRISGLCFIAVFIVLSYYCIRIMAASGQELSPRGSLHGILSIAALLLLVLKLSFVRVYRKYYSGVAVLGIAVVILTLGTTAVSAGYYFAVRAFRMPPAADTSGSARSAASGALIFRERCADCHYHDKIETKMGPGFKGLFKREKLPLSGKPVTDSNVAAQLKTPVGSMPAFPGLTDDQVEALLAYLKSL